MKLPEFIEHYVRKNVTSEKYVERVTQEYIDIMAGNRTTRPGSCSDRDCHIIMRLYNEQR